MVGGLGCVSKPSTQRYSVEELRGLAAARLGVEPASVEIPHEVGAREIERARDLAGSNSPRERLEQLVVSLLSGWGFGLSYRPVVTRTAQELLVEGEGNCLTLSALLIGLARGLGFDAYYIDASERRTEQHRVFGFSVAEGHIGAAVKLGGDLLAADFDGELGSYTRFRTLGDLEALAHFYNNRGYEAMYSAQDAGSSIPWVAVRADFERATRLAPEMAPAWNNLGVAAANSGDLAAAERYYREAIARNEGLGAPYNNLGKLFLDRDQVDRAIGVFTEATRADRANPQFRVNLGYALYRAGRLDEATAAAERSIRLGADTEGRQLLEAIRGAE